MSRLLGRIVMGCQIRAGAQLARLVAGEARSRCWFAPQCSHPLGAMRTHYRDRHLTHMISKTLVREHRG